MVFLTVPHVKPSWLHGWLCILSKCCHEAMIGGDPPYQPRKRAAKPGFRERMKPAWTMGGLPLDVNQSHPWPMNINVNKWIWHILDLISIPIKHSMYVKAFSTLKKNMHCSLVMPTTHESRCEKKRTVYRQALGIINHQRQATADWFMMIHVQGSKFTNNDDYIQ